MSIKNATFEETDKFNVLIEITKGSRLKYEYDDQLEALVLDFVFDENFSWPFNYGDILGTKGGDGDRLDACVFSTVPIDQGVVVQCKAFGMLDLLDRGEVDNKILCVPVADPLSKKLNDISDLSDAELEEIKKCYNEIAKQKQKVMVINGFENKGRADKEILKSTI